MIYLEKESLSICFVLGLGNREAVVPSQNKDEQTGKLHSLLRFSSEGAHFHPSSWSSQLFFQVIRLWALTVRAGAMLPVFYRASTVPFFPAFLRAVLKAQVWSLKAIPRRSPGDGDRLNPLLAKDSLLSEWVSSRNRNLHSHSVPSRLFRSFLSF